MNRFFRWLEHLGEPEDPRPNVTYVEKKHDPFTRLYGVEVLEVKDGFVLYRRIWKGKKLAELDNKYVSTESLSVALFWSIYEEMTDGRE